jgi:hypothetical protein
MHLLSNRTLRVRITAVFLTLIACVEARVAGADRPVANRSSDEWIVLSAGRMTVDSGTAARATVRVIPPDGVAGPVFSQAAVRQDVSVARRGPDSSRPHFEVRYALPIPPDNDTRLTGALAGMDPNVWSHNHSPGLQVLPNGDVLAIYFSARDSRGTNESDVSARFVQARLRHGAAEWDPPELFFDSRDFNDQSALLWVDGGTVRFFGGGREAPWPFKLATSSDNGASWTISLPVLHEPARDLTAQPIVNAFRDSKGQLYFAMDAAEDNSFLWRSADGGVTWQDTGGRTGARHSTIVPLGDGKTLLSIGGKNAAVNEMTPQNRSTDWGATWSESTASAFPALGGNQRPSLIRLANGHLCFVTDSYHRKKDAPPQAWTQGAGTFIALSKDDGVTWRFKRLPVELPHEADRARGTLGYATVAQGPNGLIHVLATMTHPCLHYELNEAWIESDLGEAARPQAAGTVQTFTEKHPDGSERARWQARAGAAGYRLEGAAVSF